MKKGSQLTLVSATICALALLASGCGGGSDTKGDQQSSSSQSGNNTVVSAHGCEPAKPLIPSNTVESCGGQVVDAINSKLVRFDNHGKAHNDLASEIKGNEDMDQYKVTLVDGRKFSDGTPITAKSFTKAWSWAANVNNGQLGSSFFANIKGYDDLQKQGVPADAQLSGLKVIDDKTFTVDLSSPSSTFPIQVGYTSFAPLPESFYKDTKAFGENPVSSGPYKFDSWQHNTMIKLRKNTTYKGDVKIQNGGIDYKVYTDVASAYADVQAGNLDAIDTVPTSAQKTFMKDSLVKGYNEPGSVLQMFTIPTTMEHFGQDEEGHLRRQAISMALDRKMLIDKVLGGLGVQPTDFTAPTIPGYSKNLKGSDNLKYDAKKAKDAWAKADAISKWPADKSFQMVYNADGGAKDFYDGMANSIKNTLGIKAVATPVPTFSEFRGNVNKRAYKDAAFRSAWSPDYPSPESYLLSNFASSAADGNGSNDGDYKNPKFDDLLKQAAKAKNTDEANKLFQQAEEILLQDMPAVPLYYANNKGASAKNVQGLTLRWNSYPNFAELSKKQ
ncbi:ABC transporter substrate-binding protein [Bifidobacterium sp. W8101]|uniref:peptide ABC transporter substrate-binding protein n=1 Tax=Bifidobacterium TaxID=1678 RepID=UPI0018DE2B09|nr:MULTISPECIES: ABC transporter substrate-binding protein [Bifidobacterium]MBI0125632.1 ABC transporter substrate-binding protein [Bifidobacterium choladohabitans]MBI0127201.1 ABC transporter substrate-binding protein [Bifidobacterium sp. W8103]MBI0137789.1 ABC transporter substrate-binding protein [Bifidobacterium sp. W8105]MBI0149240.1 ABC transporter substrate-binding protein [Bifidobacterium sp. W8107]